MALLKVEDFDSNYRDSFGGDDIKGHDVYTEGTEEKIGTVDDILVDEHSGEFRYIVVALSGGIGGRKVLLPVGRSRINLNTDRVYASISKEQADNLPELEEETAVDYDYEERVRGVYRAPATASSVSPVTVPEPSAPVDAAYSAPITDAVAEQASLPTYNRDSYTYQQEPSLYQMNDTDHQTLRLYEERLIANKHRTKTGEVAVGKRVETETARVSVPIEKERVIIDRVTPHDAGTVVSPGAVNFREGEVARVEIYEETPEIHKEAVVREEVRIRKEVEQNTVEAQETLRKEQLDVNVDGRPIVDSSDRI